MQQVIWKNLNKDEQEKCLRRPVFANDKNLSEAVADILDNVLQNGDEAVKDYTLQFDGASLDGLRVDQEEGALDPEICAAIDTAYKNIYTFHEKQGFQEYELETMAGINCQRIVRPLEAVGLYVPGGTAPLVSTTLMLGVPAQIAQCKNKFLCTPCNKDGEINPYILYAAKLCGISDVFRVGGAQAIGAMAFGTDTIPKCDKILGPGNSYVTEAKMQVSKNAFGAAIDMPAGPSEVCVVADETSNPAFVAADLLSQAEHGTDSQVLLLVPSLEVADRVRSEIEVQLESLSRQDIAKAALQNSTAIIYDDMKQALSVVNRYAPEHLIFSFEGAEQYLDDIQNAGSIFLGGYTPESAGDYASGTNHALPTYGYAKAYSGLSVEAFQKTMTVQSITKTGLDNIGDTVEILATLEGLDAHARAISIRKEAA